MAHASIENLVARMFPARGRHRADQPLPDLNWGDDEGYRVEDDEQGTVGSGG
jgi:hypothetical protein